MINNHNYYAPKLTIINNLLRYTNGAECPNIKINRKIESTKKNQYSPSHLNSLNFNIIIVTHYTRLTILTVVLMLKPQYCPSCPFAQFKPESLKAAIIISRSIDYLFTVDNLQSENTLLTAYANDTVIKATSANLNQVTKLL